MNVVGNWAHLADSQPGAMITTIFRVSQKYFHCSICFTLSSKIMFCYSKFHFKQLNFKLFGKEHQYAASPLLLFLKKPCLKKQKKS